VNTKVETVYRAIYFTLSDRNFYNLSVGLARKTKDKIGTDEINGNNIAKAGVYLYVA